MRGKRSVLVRTVSALASEADILERDWHARFVPKADVARN